MSINITKEIGAGYEAYLDQQIDAHVDGAPILRRDTYPYVGGHTGIVDFAAGWQAALSAGQATTEPADFDAWQANPYTKALKKSVVEDYMPRWQVIPEPPTAKDLLPHEYLLAKLAMVIPLFQEARDALPAITVASAKLHGVRLDLGDRMDIAGTYSLDDWLAAPTLGDQG